MDRLWTKSFVLMTISMLFLFTGFYFLVPTFPSFIQSIGGSESQVGLIIGAFTLSAVVFRPIVGAMLDRYGRRPFILWGLLFFTAAMYAYNWAGGVAALIALRILHGTTWAFSTTAVGTAVTDLIPPGRRGEGMGWFGTAMTVAMAIGPMLGIWVVEQYSYDGLFTAGAALALIAFVLAFTAKVPFQRKSDPGRIVLFERSLLTVSLAIFFLAMAYGGITTFIALFAESIEVNAGTFFLVYAVALTLIRPVAGKLSDRHGETFVIVPALVVTIGALLVLSVSTGLAGVIVSAILYGMGFGSAQPALQAASLRLIAPERRGVANASFMTAFDLGIGLGSIVLGLVGEYSSYQMLFTVCACSVGVCLVIVASAVRRQLRVGMID